MKKGSSSYLVEIDLFLWDFPRISNYFLDISLQYEYMQHYVTTLYIKMFFGMCQPVILENLQCDKTMNSLLPLINLLHSKKNETDLALQFLV